MQWSVNGLVLSLWEGRHKAKLTSVSHRKKGIPRAGTGHSQTGPQRRAQGEWDTHG